MHAKCRTKADAHDKMGFQYISISVYIVGPMRGSSGGTGGPDPPPPEESQNYQASIQRCAIISTPAKRHLKAFRWQTDDGPLLVIFGSSLPLKKKEEKTLSEFGSQSDPNGIQERRFRQFKNLGMR